MSLQDATSYQVQVIQNELVPAKEQQKSPLKYILEQQKFRTREDLKTLRNAIEMAGNTTNYNREDLHRIYRECWRDPQLTGQWESRKMKTKEKQFKFVKGDTENKDLTKLFESQWFMDWQDVSLDSKLWGFTLIEFGPWTGDNFVNYKVNDKFYDAINVIDRDNVKPELGVITNTPGQAIGIGFDDPGYQGQLMFIGKTRDWGLMYKLVKYILFKDNCLGNWADWAEIFGMDKRIGYTDKDGEDRLRFLEAIKNLGSNAYGVFTQNDRVEFAGTSRTDAYQVYRAMCDYIDASEAKVIWGQDVVTNNTGRVVGEVGENVADMYGSNDAKFIKYLVNKRLIPFMENLGVNFQGCEFDWDNSEKIAMIDRATIDKQIADMGFEIDEKYITDTYGVPVKKKEEPKMLGTPTPKTAKQIRAFYGEVD